MGPASWPAGLPEENQVGLASKPRRRGSLLAGKCMLTSRVKGKAKKNQKRLPHKQSKCKVAAQPGSPQLFFGQARLQRGSYLKASGKDEEHVLDVPMKLLLIRLRRCLRMELAHRLYKTEDTRLRGTSCRASRSHCVVRMRLSWA